MESAAHVIAPRRYRQTIRCLPAACLVLLAVVVGLTFPGGCHPSGKVSAAAEAAIVDQLTPYGSTSAFAARVVPLLADFGFKTDLFRGSEVTVDFYRRLPGLGYRLIILRNHSGLLTREGQLNGGTWLFTSEPHNQIKYLDERLDDRIVKARTGDDQPWVFAVGADFAARSMAGNFRGSVVIAMGCYSLYQPDLAGALVNRGARAYLGWDGNLFIDYDDDGTARMINYLCRQNLPVRTAVEKAMADLGPVPDFKTRLAYYPESVGDRTLRQLLK